MSGPAQPPVDRRHDHPRISQHNYAGQRKLTLWRRDPCCFWCGRLTVIWSSVAGMSVPSDTATLDHLHSRNQLLQSGADGRRLRLGDTVLACESCNRARGEVEKKALKGLVDAQLVGFVAGAVRPDSARALAEWLQFIKETVGRAKEPRFLIPK